MRARRDIESPEDPEKTIKEALAMVTAVVLTLVYVIGICAAKDLGYVLADQEDQLESQLESLC